MGEWMSLIVFLVTSLLVSMVTIAPWLQATFPPEGAGASVRYLMKSTPSPRRRFRLSSLFALFACACASLSRSASADARSLASCRLAVSQART